MTMFKITRKKVTFGGLHSPAEEHKRNLRKKNEEEKSDQRDLQHRRLLLVLIKIPPGAESSNL